MDDGEFQPRSGIPARHFLFAIALTLIVAGAGCVWMSAKALQTATAVLAFDPEKAQHLDTGLLSTREPAVAMADSILSDATVAELAKQADPASPKTAARVGEFRAALELTQPSAEELQVRYVDAVPARWAAMLHADALNIGLTASAGNANAVAHALATWNPAQAAVPPPAAQPQSPVTPSASQSEATPAAAAQPVPQPAAVSHPIADGLGEVASQLVATDRELDQMGGEGRHGRRSAESSYMQSKQQYLLKARVSATARKLDQLGTQGAAEEVKTRLDEARDAVHSILAGGHTNYGRGRRYGFNGAGTSAGEVRRERAALRDAIDVVKRDRQAIERIESAQADAEAKEPTAAAGNSSQTTPSPAATATSSVGAPAAGASTSAATSASGPASAATPVQEQNLPPAGMTGWPSVSGASNPLSVVQLAGPMAPPRLWIPIAIGVLCGLVYLGLAALANRRAVMDELEPSFSGRLITPAGPFHPTSEPVRAVIWTEQEMEPPRIEATPRQRASFALDPTPGGSAVPHGPSLPKEEDARVTVEEDPATERDDEPPSEIK